jgi:putative PIN family toxin of toxin-antitoxin system
MKVVLDTNVIVSALLSPYGNPAAILNMFFNDAIQVYYCDNILSEYSDVLFRPALNIKPEKAKNFFKILSETGTPVEPAVSSITLPDEDDRTFYDTARHCGAILITGNIKHYPDENHIMTPREFIDMLNTDEITP